MKLQMYRMTHSKLSSIVPGVDMRLEASCNFTKIMGRNCTLVGIVIQTVAIRVYYQSFTISVKRSEVKENLKQFIAS